MSGGLGWEIRVLASGHWIVEKDCFISLGMTSTITSQRLRRRTLTKIYNLALGECQFSIRAVVLEELFISFFFFFNLCTADTFFRTFLCRDHWFKSPASSLCVQSKFLGIYIYIYIIFKHFHFKNSPIDILLNLNFKLNYVKIIMM